MAAQRTRLAILRNTQAVLLLGLAALIALEALVDVPGGLVRGLIIGGVVVWAAVAALVVSAEYRALRAAGAPPLASFRSAVFGTQVRLVTGAPLRVFVPALVVAAALVVVTLTS